MTDRWTAETEELVARAILSQRRNRPWEAYDEDDQQTFINAARVVLTALADAGLLLPPGGETRIERGKYVPSTGGVSPCTNRCRQERDHAHDRERTVHIGPWVPVTDGGEG